MFNPNEAAPTAPKSPEPGSAAPVTPVAPATPPAALSQQTVPAAPAAPENPIAKAADELVKTGVKGIRDAIQKLPDTQLVEQILSMPDTDLNELEQQYLAKTKSSTETPETLAASSGSPAAPAAPGTPTPAIEDKEETISLKRSELGTYAPKDRSLKDAILELMKGKKESDEIIAYNKNKRIPAMEKLGQTLVLENQKLTKELTELRAKVAQTVTTAKVAESTVEVPTLPNVDDYDMFDPDQKTKYVAALSAHNEGLNKKHQAEIEALRNPPKAETTEQAPTAPAGTLPAEVAREYEEVDLFQANPETQGIFRTEKPVPEVEKEYLALVGNLARLKNINTIYDAAGRFMPEIQQLINVYFKPETPDGQALRAAAEAAKIAPSAPSEKDMRTLFNILDIRRVRREHQRENPVTHVVEPISYDQAFDIDQRLHPEKYSAASSVAPVIPAGGTTAIERGQQYRQQFAPEVPSTTAVPVTAHQSSTVEEFFRLMRKPIDKYTTEEISRLRSLMKSEAQMADDEIDAWFTKPQPK